MFNEGKRQFLLKDPKVKLRDKKYYLTYFKKFID